MSFINKLKNKFKQNENKEEVSKKYQEGMTKTRNSFSSKINDLIARYRKVDEDFLKSWKKYSLLLMWVLQL